VQFPGPKLTCRSFQFPFLRLVSPGSHLVADDMPKRRKTLTDRHKEQIRDEVEKRRHPLQATI
jgi:hypothetical protein